jgi:hypothetical protein
MIAADTPHGAANSLEGLVPHSLTNMSGNATGLVIVHSRWRFILRAAGDLSCHHGFGAARPTGGCRGRHSRIETSVNSVGRSALLHRRAIFNHFAASLCASRIEHDELVDLFQPQSGSMLDGGSACETGGCARQRRETRRGGALHRAMHSASSHPTPSAMATAA